MTYDGPLGSNTNPGYCDGGTLARTLHLAPAPLCGSSPGPTQVKYHAMQAAQALLRAASSLDTRSAIGHLLGERCFTAGVAAGMAKALVVGVAELLKLFKTLALAEYHEERMRHGFWDRFGRAFAQGGMPAATAALGMEAASQFWPGFDRLASDAYAERQRLFEAVAYAFEHPGEVFSTITAHLKKNYEAFKQHRERNTLAGAFEAGMLFGELLLEVLLILDGVTAVAKIAAKIPGLLKLLPRLEELAPALRRGLGEASRVAKQEARASQPVVRPRNVKPKPPTPIKDEVGAGAAEVLAQGGRGSASEIFDGAGIRVDSYKPDGQVIGQLSNETCVAASCRMIASDAGVVLSEQTVAAALETTAGGANVLKSAEVLDALGVSGGKAFPSASLADLEAGLAGGRSAVVGVDLPGLGRHAMVVDKIADGAVLLRDPLPLGQGSSFAMPLSEFQQVWSGRLVTF
jgi:hypothetical protein